MADEFETCTAEALDQQVSNWAFFERHPYVLHEPNGERYFTSLEGAAGAAWHTQYPDRTKVWAEHAGQTFEWSQLVAAWNRWDRLPKSWEARTGARELPPPRIQ